MAQPVTSLGWNIGDEETGDRITLAPRDIASDRKKEKQVHRHPSQRTIDPKSAIPIEYRSLYCLSPPFFISVANIFGIARLKSRMKEKESSG